MEPSSIMSSFKVYISLQIRHQAKQFAALYKPSEQAGKVYLNYLAAYCAYTDLRRDVQIDFAGSDVNNPIIQALMDTGSLKLTGFGKLECRPILQGSDIMYVPEDVWGDRIGYLAVQLNEDLTEGKILGFVKAVHQTQVPITDLQSLDEFLDYLDYLEKLEPLLLNLKNWVSRVTQSGWTLVSEAIDEMLPESSPEMQWAFRSRSTITTDQGVTCQKRLSQIPFRISLYPRMALDYDYDIIVRLNLESLSMASPMETRGKPSQEKSQPLENELNVAILDENRSLVKEEIFHIGHETTDTAVTFDIQADQGDSFIIKVAYQGDTTEEIINL
jgi:hypothetical protein